VLLSVREIPLRLDRPAVAERLERAIDCLYTTLDSDLESPAHLEGLRQATSALVEARTLLARAGDPARVEPLKRAVAILDSAAARLKPAADEVALLQVTGRMSLRRASIEVEIPKPRRFRASRGLPQLHSLARSPMRPQVQLDPIVPVDEPPAASAPPPKLTLERLEALAKAAAAGTPMAIPELYDDEEPAPDTRPEGPIEYAYEPAIEEREVVRRLARAALEDIAALSALRHPIPTETWLDQAPFEQRLLNNIDYFASLGGNALAMVPLYHAESDVPDPARAFAVALALGCVEGFDTAYAAVATFKQSPPEEFPGWVEGWWLAPNPAIDEALADLLGHPKTRLAGVALDVLAARGSLPPDAPGWLLERHDPELTAKLARALGRCLPKERAIQLLKPLLRGPADDETHLTVLESLLRRGWSRAREACRQLVSSREGKPRADAARLLALSGQPDDAPLLVEVAAAAPSPRLARALGRFGHVTMVPQLMAWLAADDDKLVPAAAEALDRITGAGLRETVEEPWDIELPPEAQQMEGIPHPTRKVVKVVTDPPTWEGWWAREGARFEQMTKWRGGRPFAPIQIVDELEAKETPPDAREEAALEVAIATGVTSPFSPRDWVARQRRHLAELREVVRDRAFADGGWCYAGASTGDSDHPRSSGRGRL
jgi:hypothetical protein